MLTSPLTRFISLFERQDTIELQDIDRYGERVDERTGRFETRTVDGVRRRPCTRTVNGGEYFDRRIVCGRRKNEKRCICG